MCGIIHNLLTKTIQIKERTPIELFIDVQNLNNVRYADDKLEIRNSGKDGKNYKFVNENKV